MKTLNEEKMDERNEVDSLSLHRGPTVVSHLLLAHSASSVVGHHPRYSRSKTKTQIMIGE